MSKFVALTVVALSSAPAFAVVDLTVVPVPVPGTVMLVAAGAALVALFRR